jgi:hypothetical protein
MPSTYSTNLGIELPEDGELDGLWGDVVNLNMNILDRAINGSVSLTLSGTSSTLTTSDGVLSNGQYKLLVLGGSPSGTHTITISPNDAQKVYFVRNTTAQSVVFTQGSGGNVTVAAGDSGIIYSNGGGASAAVVNLTDDFAMSSVKITGGSITGATISGITDLAVADGGTGVSTLTGIAKGNGTSAFTAAVAGTDYLAPAAIGTTVQAWDANLDQIAALAPTLDNFIVGNGSAWTLETPANALLSLGVTSTAAELNILDGAILSTAELNFVDGVTSSIQTQLDNRVTSNADDALTGGYTTTAVDDGTQSSGTYTPTPAGGNMKRIVNGGAFTLAAPTASGDYTLVIQITNNASAGAITLTGFNRTVGDVFTTTNGHDFFVFVAKCNGFVLANVQALQ